MLSYIKGICHENYLGTLLIAVDTGGTQGHQLGYEILVPQHEKYTQLPESKEVELFVYTHIKQDGTELYGFLEREEKRLFKTLLEVSGVGPKSALSALSMGPWSYLVQAIIDDEQSYLAKIPGVGKKTAQRLVLDLKDKLIKKQSQGLLIDTQGSVLAKAPSVRRDGNIYHQAGLALKELGFGDAVIARTLKGIEQEFNPSDLESLIRRSLQQLSVPKSH